jgi:NADH:ubiquinone oxidoreductase subunit 6 (subunit J)
MVDTFGTGLLAIGILLCGIQAIRAEHLITAALWLAGVSASLSALLFVLGASQVAVMELSVGAGLVTVLFVFAISIAGELTRDLPSLIPKSLAWVLCLLVVALLGWLLSPLQGSLLPQVEPDFAVVLWQQRALDVWVQIALIFAGVLGVLGLLADVFRVSVTTETAGRPQSDLANRATSSHEVEDALAH